jgi:hypothetical protein
MRSDFALNHGCRERNFMTRRQGAKNRPQKCANARRDENPGIERAKIPAETPYLASYRKPPVCADWMVGLEGTELPTPTPSSNRSLTSESGTEFFDAETDG